MSRLAIGFTSQYESQDENRRSDLIVWGFGRVWAGAGYSPDRIYADQRRAPELIVNVMALGVDARFMFGLVMEVGQLAARRVDLVLLSSI
jgi:hypothetical protein